MPLLQVASAAELDRVREGGRDAARGGLLAQGRIDELLPQMLEAQTQVKAMARELQCAQQRGDEAEHRNKYAGAEARLAPPV